MESSSPVVQSNARDSTCLKISNKNVPQLDSQKISVNESNVHSGLKRAIKRKWTAMQQTASIQVTINAANVHKIIANKKRKENATKGKYILLDIDNDQKDCH